MELGAARPGKSVLIHSAAGGVGQFALQICQVRLPGRDSAPRLLLCALACPRLDSSTPPSARWWEWIPWRS